MLNANDLQALLANATEDTLVHIDYIAGSPKALTAQAIEEFNQAADYNGDRGIPSTHYTGQFGGFKTTKRGEVVLSLFVHNRGSVGQWRTFNPALGTVLAASVVG